MPPLFGWQIRPAHITPPVERDLAAEVEEIDRRLTAIALIPAGERWEELWWQLDRLLDRRNTIRPPRQPVVPVIPGRTS